MTCTYEEYLKQPKAIPFEKMQMIHAEMLAEIGANAEAIELYDELICDNRANRDYLQMFLLRDPCFSNRKNREYGEHDNRNFLSIHSGKNL